MSRYVPSEYSFICLFFNILIFGVHVIIVMRPTNYIPTWGQGGTQRSWGWSFPIPHTAIPNQVKTLRHLDPEKWHPNIAKWKGKKKVHENSSQSPCTFGPHFHLIFCLLFFFFTLAADPIQALNTTSQKSEEFGGWWDPLLVWNVPSRRWSWLDFSSLGSLALVSRHDHVLVGQIERLMLRVGINVHFLRQVVIICTLKAPG